VTPDTGSLPISGAIPLEKQVMAKAKGTNKSEFIRNALGKNANLNLKQINDLWSRSGGESEISAVLFYQVRRKLGLKRAEYRWMQNEGQP
jgi:hypothetical protein